MPNTDADIIQPGKYQKYASEHIFCMTRNGPGLHQDVTKTPHSPGTRTYKDQEFTRMLPGCYKECRDVTRMLQGCVAQCKVLLDGAKTLLRHYKKRYKL